MALYIAHTLYPIQNIKINIINKICIQYNKRMVLVYL